MRAVIFSHESGGSYVLDRNGCFRFVRGHTSQPVGSEIEIREQPPINIMRITSAAACLVLVISVSIFAWMWNVTNHYIYVDINPSVETQFNSFGRLRSATPLNDDGAELLRGLSLRGTAEDVMVSLIDAAKQKNFLTATEGKTEVLITVIATGGRSPDSQISAISAALEKNGMQGYTVIEAGTMTLRDRADGLGVSPGRLRLAEAMLQGDGQHMSLEELLRIPINELFAAINNLPGADIPDQSGDNISDSSGDPAISSHEPTSPVDSGNGGNGGNGRISNDNDDDNGQAGDTDTMTDGQTPSAGLPVPATSTPANGTLLTDPTVTEPPVTDPPVNDPPTTNDPPVTDPPANDPPTNEPPATDPPANDPPTGDTPANVPPVINPPVNVPPVNDPPINEPPSGNQHEDDCDCEECVGTGEHPDDCDCEDCVGTGEHPDDCDCEDCVGTGEHPDDCDCEDCVGTGEHPDDCDCEDCVGTGEHPDDCDCEDCVGDDDEDDGESGEGFGATVFAQVEGSGNARTVAITVTDTFGTYEQSFGYVNGTLEETYIIEGTHLDYEVYVGFSGNKVVTVYITDFETVDGDTFGATVVAVVEGNGVDRVVVITVTDSLSVEHEQIFTYINGTACEVYIVEGTGGRFTVYIIFQGNAVRAAMIIGYEDG